MERGARKWVERSGVGAVRSAPLHSAPLQTRSTAPRILNPVEDDSQSDTPFVDELSDVNFIKELCAEGVLVRFASENFTLFVKLSFRVIYVFRV